MTTEHDGELQEERGTNEFYMRKMRQDAEPGEEQTFHRLSGPRNTLWVNRPTSSGRRGPHVEPLVGRVALRDLDPLLGSSFYIGSGYFETNDLVVISWAAPMAQIFYVGSSARVDIAELLAARRTFARSADDLTGYEDAIEPNVAGHPFRNSSRSTDTRIVTGEMLTAPEAHGSSIPAPPIAIARPPRKVKRPKSPAKPVQPSSVPVASPDLLTAETGEPVAPEPEGAENGASTADVVHANALGDRVSSLRAPETVLKALTAPRTGRLQSLLRTLQPQQYELVSSTEEEHLVIQGHPGTGKTAIGLHRAAFLTDPEHLPEGQKMPKGEVLVLGPTSAWVEHVKPVLNDLAPNDCVAWSLPHFYAQVGGFLDPNLPAVADQNPIPTSSDPLGAAVLRAEEHYRGPRTVKDFTDHLFDAGDQIVAATGDRRVLDFLASAKSFEFARGHSRFHPVLALCGLLMSGIGLANRFRHIIIDEAQDLRPIDLVMLRLLVSHGINFTLLGDMNQRRSDFTAASWDDLAQEAGIARSDGTAPVTSITVGYRSTNQILGFAAGLLDRSDRRAEALRNGPRPRVERCLAARDLESRVSAEALSLLGSTQGIVAVITMAPDKFSDHLRKQGWKRGRPRHSWRPTPDASDVLVLHPDNARGLEFDGVVVVEPDDFPSPLGRHGVLYTSLTRATKELVVVHHNRLPRGLSGSRR